MSIQSIFSNATKSILGFFSGSKEQKKDDIATSTTINTSSKTPSEPTSPTSSNNSIRSILKSVPKQNNTLPKENNADTFSPNNSERTYYNNSVKTRNDVGPKKMEAEETTTQTSNFFSNLFGDINLINKERDSNSVAVSQTTTLAKFTSDVAMILFNKYLNLNTPSDQFDKSSSGRSESVKSTRSSNILTDQNSPQSVSKSDVAYFTKRNNQEKAENHKEPKIKEPKIKKPSLEELLEILKEYKIDDRGNVMKKGSDKPQAKKSTENTAKLIHTLTKTVIDKNPEIDIESNKALGIATQMLKEEFFERWKNRNGETVYGFRHEPIAAGYSNTNEYPHLASKTLQPGQRQNDHPNKYKLEVIENFKKLTEKVDTVHTIRTINNNKDNEGMQNARKEGRESSILTKYLDRMNSAVDNGISR